MILSTPASRYFQVALTSSFAGTGGIVEAMTSVACAGHKNEGRLPARNVQCRWLAKFYDVVEPRVAASRSSRGYLGGVVGARSGGEGRDAGSR